MCTCYSASSTMGAYGCYRMSINLNAPVYGQLAFVHSCLDHISTDDYFSKSAEFRAWLSKEVSVLTRLRRSLSEDSCVYVSPEGSVLQ